MTTRSDASTAEIIDRGINCLVEELGVVEAERFIAALLREKSDYTRWRQRYFADASSDVFHAAAVAYGKANPL